MAYIGIPAVDRFTATKAASVYSGNGSTTAFTLEHSVGADEDILVSVDGVIQEPSVAYAVSSGTTLTFTAAPSTNSGNNIFVYYLFRTIGTVTHPPTSALSATSGTFTGNIVIPNAGNIGSASDTDAMAISSAGVVNFTQTPTLVAKRLANTPAFEAHMSATVQNLTDNTITKMAANTEVFDSDGKYDNSTNFRFTPGVAGKYFVYAGAIPRSESNFDIVIAEISIYKNGSEYRKTVARPEKDDNFNETSVSIQAIIDLDADDYVEIFANCNTNGGSQWQFIERTKSNYFGAYKLAGL